MSGIKQNITFHVCECGRPATLKDSTGWQCARCKELNAAVTADLDHQCRMRRVEDARAAGEVEPPRVSMPHRFWSVRGLTSQSEREAKRERMRLLRAARYAAGLNGDGKPRVNTKRPELAGIGQKNDRRAYMRAYNALKREAA